MAGKETLVVERDKVVKMLEALDFKTAAKWNARRLRGKLGELIETAEASGWEVEDDEDLNDLLQSIVKSGGEFEVVDELPAEPEPEVDEGEDGQEEGVGEQDAAEEDQKEGAEAAVEQEDAEPVEPKKEPKRKPRKKAKEADSMEVDDVDEELEKLEKRAAELKKEKKAKKTKTAKVKKPRENAGPDVGNPKGITSLKNRLFCAGAVLKKHGLKVGLTDELVSEVDDTCGKPNKAASKTQLSYAWHVVNGYLNG